MNYRLPLTAAVRTGAALVAAVVIGAALGGCSEDTTLEPWNGAPVILSSVPAPGSTSIPLDAMFTVRFSAAMDRASVEGNLHLRRVMGHMGDVPGSFRWNGDGTECTFLPDSLLAPDTMYRMHAGGEMHSMDGRPLGHGQGMMMGGMMGGGMMGDEDDMEWDCTTGNSVGMGGGTEGDGHSEHHEGGGSGGGMGDGMSGGTGSGMRGGAGGGGRR